MFSKENGKTVFDFGKERSDYARMAAADCVLFYLDCEEECLEDEDKTCYNCRYRRWTAESFECLKGGIHYE